MLSYHMAIDALVSQPQRLQARLWPRNTWREQARCIVPVPDQRPESDSPPDISPSPQCVSIGRESTMCVLKMFHLCYPFNAAPQISTSSKYTIPTRWTSPFLPASRTRAFKPSPLRTMLSERTLRRRPDWIKRIHRRRRRGQCISAAGICIPVRSSRTIAGRTG